MYSLWDCSRVYNGATRYENICCEVYYFIIDSEQALENAVAMQPVHVVVDAGQSSFQLYESGIYYELNCTSTRLDHSMLVVGYGESTAGEEYWIVKNSWGKLTLYL